MCQSTLDVHNHVSKMQNNVAEMDGTEQALKVTHSTLIKLVASSTFTFWRQRFPLTYENELC